MMRGGFSLHPENLPFALVLFSFNRREPHRRTPGRSLADRLGIGCVVLLPLDIGGLNQLQIMAALPDLVSWEMGAAAGVYRHDARPQVPEKKEASDFAVGSCETHPPRSIRAARLKHILRHV